MRHVTPGSEALSTGRAGTGERHRHWGLLSTRGAALPQQRITSVRMDQLRTQHLDISFSRVRRPLMGLRM